jgi:linoleoyl-CoA desaturase
MNTRVKFSNNLNADFFDTLRHNVNDYFKTKNICRFGNYKMVIKSIVMILLYLGPYAVLVSGAIVNPLLIWAMWMIMGFGMAGIGLAIMHDANHGSYSSNAKVNNMMGYLINLVGGSVINWKIQHNVLHHSFTNIDGHDGDITTIPILRFSPSQKFFKIHKYQYIYAWLFYSIMTINWFIHKDIPQLLRYRKEGRLDSKQNNRFGWLMTELIMTKVLYALYIIVIPIIVLDIPWWVTILAFLTMQVISGLLLTTVFQLAHIMPNSKFPSPDNLGNIKNSWAIHQLTTTTNFSPKSKILSWYVGGLNYQIEHHLFPNICHIHYKEIAPIVRKTAQEFGFPYNSEPTFIEAVKSHVRMLKMLGRPAYN